MTYPMDLYLERMLFNPRRGVALASGAAVLGSALVRWSARRSDATGCWDVSLDETHARQAGVALALDLMDEIRAHLGGLDHRPAGAGVAA
jgi:hypothetical protein